MEQARGTEGLTLFYTDLDRSKIDVHEIDKQGRKVCYPCCGKRDSADMSATGRAVLYLTEGGPEEAVVSNWPGTLKFRVRYKRVGSHNLAGRRVDVWFTDSDGREWHGINYGHNSQLCHCRRLRSAA